MPTRVERLEKRKDRVNEKADEKINRQKYGGRTAKVRRRRVANINKKIVKTKARVATRAKKKVAKVVKKTGSVLKRARKASAAYKSVKANPKSTKSNVKRATSRLNRLGKKAGGDKVMYPSMSYMDTFSKKKK